ncbi:MAG: hypothetical protein KBS52_04745 [Clostridiales bacterium]|nr:hypothetical protein [Candidatus Equinaster intestinalis]
MYYCQDCKRKFNSPKKITETHSLPCPPYEVFYVCPFCLGADFKKIEPRYCKCCGARVYKKGDYCSVSCKKQGEYLYEMQRKRRKELFESPLYRAVRQVEEYNRKNGTHLSYGQFFAMKEAGK